MSQKYLNINPIARMMSIETFRIFENESVDELIQKLSTSLGDVFKKVAVDFALHPGVQCHRLVCE